MRMPVTSGLHALTKMLMGAGRNNLVGASDDLAIIAKEMGAMAQLPPSLPAWWNEGERRNPYERKLVTDALAKFKPHERDILESTPIRTNLSHWSTPLPGAKSWMQMNGSASPGGIIIDMPARQRSGAIGPVTLDGKDIAHHELRHVLLHQLLQDDESGLGAKTVRELYEAGQQDPNFAAAASQGHGGMRYLFTERPPGVADHRSRSDHVRGNVADFENDNFAKHQGLQEYYATTAEGSGRSPLRTDKVDMSHFFDALDKIAQSKAKR
jgi:hypothetical protein